MNNAVFARILRQNLDGQSMVCSYGLLWLKMNKNCYPHHMCTLVRKNYIC
jgi:hypothetical protein